MADPKLLHPCPTCGRVTSPLEEVPCHDCRREAELCKGTLANGKKCIRRGTVFVLEIGGRLCPSCADARRQRAAAGRMADETADSYFNSVD